ncbi:hypothetical protein EVAR_20603_1 [Eumeta japonica]|uniref:Uncharacterized protein n=1 Tax=Eumeta variegata TaxID=151549 RepID=A0A4C1USN5_EUMVA|nr:hypothetical protein EVAR_20603_1 [Eumeta japonica]
MSRERAPIVGNGRSRTADRVVSLDAKHRHGQTSTRSHLYPRRRVATANDCRLPSVVKAAAGLDPHSWNQIVKRERQPFARLASDEDINRLEVARVKSPPRVKLPGIANETVHNLLVDEAVVHNDSVCLNNLSLRRIGIIKFILKIDVSCRFVVIVRVCRGGGGGGGGSAVWARACGSVGSVKGPFDVCRRLNAPPAPLPAASPPSPGPVASRH